MKRKRVQALPPSSSNELSESAILLQHTPFPDALVQIILEYTVLLPREDALSKAARVIRSTLKKKFDYPGSVLPSSVLGHLKKPFFGESIRVSLIQVTYFVIICYHLKERKWRVRVDECDIMSISTNLYVLAKIKGESGRGQDIVYDNVTVGCTKGADFVVTGVIKDGVHYPDCVITPQPSAASLRDISPSSMPRRKRKTELEQLS